VAKRKLLSFLIPAKQEGKHVVGYRAPAKGNTLLNSCGVQTDLIAYTVDRSPISKDIFCPGFISRFMSLSGCVTLRPGYLLILPWNIREEVMQEKSYIQEWGEFVVPIPEVQVYS
jgi:hypothetical protein